MYICIYDRIFEENNIVHGDIRLCQIIENEEKIIKITHHTLVHPLKTNYMKSLI
jgi:hypothetical protein